MSDNVVRERRKYELGYLLVPTVNSADLAVVVNELMGVITSSDGEIFASGDPQLIELAYDMTKRINNKNVVFSSGYFGWVRFDLDADKIEEVMQKLKSNSRLLRFLLIKLTSADLYEKKMPSRGVVDAGDDKEEKKKKEKEGGNEDEDKENDGEKSDIKQEDVSEDGGDEKEGESA